MKKGITVGEMLALSQELLARHPEWGKPTPESGLNQMAWLVTEVGEVLDIIKKKGPIAVMRDATTRHDMLIEIIDCYMYLADVLNRYDFSAEDFSKAYREKMRYNFERTNQRYWKSESKPRGLKAKD